MSEPPKPVLVELEYSGPRTPEPLPLARTDPLFRDTVSCWLLPLVLGVADFLVYLVVRDEFLEFAGGWIILFGTVCSLIGFICTLCFLARRWGKSGNRFTEVVRPTIVLLLLLASNYGVALLLIIVFSDLR